MFDISNISRDRNSGMHICICQCDSPHDAENLVSTYIDVSRMFSMSGCMYHRGLEAYIEAYYHDEVVRIASYINANYFMPPLDVYVFYGSSRIGLESRWCVGFDFPNATQFIDFLNTQDRFITADKNPQNWQDKQGNTFSVVMLTGITEPVHSSELDEMINQCLKIIHNTTFRQLKPHILH